MTRVARPPWSRAERAAFAAVAVSVTVVLATAAVLATPRVRDAIMNPVAYSVGQRIDVPPTAYASSPYTLLIFGRGTCAASRQAAPFLQSLANETRRLGIAPRLVSEDAHAAGADVFVASLGLQPSEVLRVNVSTLRVRVVPTVVVVDRFGRILYVREGVVPASATVPVLDAVRAATR